MTCAPSSYIQSFRRVFASSLLVDGKRREAGGNENEAQQARSTQKTMHRIVFERRRPQVGRWQLSMIEILVLIVVLLSHLFNLPNAVTKSTEQSEKRGKY